jgi:transcriptional regulator GlxA family with amidase domain
MVDGAVITDEGNIYSSGGASSLWNLVLYLLEKYSDRDIAILASKYFAIDIDRNSQAAFTIFTGQKDHRDSEVLKAQAYIEENFQQKITVDELADKVAVSRRTFERRFKQATNNTPVEYMQRVRIEAAKRSFEASRKNVSEVMFDVGYTDTRAFRDVFKKITGLTPVEYRNKYSKMADVGDDMSGFH